MNRCIDTIDHNERYGLISVAMKVFQGAAHLLHFTDDDIGFVIKFGNGGGVPKVARTRPTRMFVVSKHGGQE